MVWAGAVGPQDRIARRYHAFGDGTLLAFPPGDIFGEEHIALGAGHAHRRPREPVGGHGPGPAAAARVPRARSCASATGARSAGAATSSPTGRSSIGDDVMTGPHCYITDQNHVYADPDTPDRPAVARPRTRSRSGPGRGSAPVRSSCPGTRLGPEHRGRRRCGGARRLPRPRRARPGCRPGDPPVRPRHRLAAGPARPAHRAARRAGPPRRGERRPDERILIWLSSPGSRRRPGTRPSCVAPPSLLDRARRRARSASRRPARPSDLLPASPPAVEPIELTPTPTTTDRRPPPAHAPTTAPAPPPTAPPPPRPDHHAPPPRAIVPTVPPAGDDDDDDDGDDDDRR